MASGCGGGCGGRGWGGQSPPSPKYQIQSEYLIVPPLFPGISLICYNNTQSCRIFTRVRVFLYPCTNAHTRTGLAGWLIKKRGEGRLTKIFNLQAIWALNLLREALSWLSFFSFLKSQHQLSLSYPMLQQLSSKWIILGIQQDPGQKFCLASAKRSGK